MGKISAFKRAKPSEKYTMHEIYSANLHRNPTLKKKKSQQIEGH